MVDKNLYEQSDLKIIDKEYPFCIKNFRMTTKDLVKKRTEITGKTQDSPFLHSTTRIMRERCAGS